MERSLDDVIRKPEYRKSGEKTNFEVFLSHTTQKEASAAKLADLLGVAIKPNGKLLDIGAGNGEFLAQTLSQMQGAEDFDVTLVEPSEDLSNQLSERFSAIVADRRLHVAPGGFDELSEGQVAYDIILASHLFYHFPRRKWEAELRRMLSLLSDDGKLIVILRGKDDVYEFMSTMKPLLFADYDPDKTVTMDSLLEFWPQESRSTLAMHAVDATLTVPLEDNPQDAIAIIEFYLRADWDSIPAEIQQKCLDFVRQKGNVLQQKDVIAVAER